METQGAFPGWLNRMWWVLLPGVSAIAYSMLGVTLYLLSAPSDPLSFQVTGLAGVGGDGAGASLLLSWLLVSLVLMHVWFFVAAGFVIQRNEYLTGRDKWKVVGTVLVLLAVYSPVITFAMSGML